MQRGTRTKAINNAYVMNEKERMRPCIKGVPQIENESFNRTYM